MRVLNFGSMHLDHVYRVDHFARMGETIPAVTYTVRCGGSGLNQSVALARAGVEVYHAGKIGPDGERITTLLESNGVNIQRLIVGGDPTGHSITQVDKMGQNAIVSYGCPNCNLTEEETVAAMEGFGEGDLLLIQNQINKLTFMIEQAHRRGMQIAFNPSPYDPAVKELPLERVNVLLLNLEESAALSGKKDEKEMEEELTRRYPNAILVITKGNAGAVCIQGGERYDFGIYNVIVVDTAAAGDTFTGYFLAAHAEGQPVDSALRIASRAASLCVSTAGGASSIPTRDEVENSMMTLLENKDETKL
jgi:ribokinase